MGLGGSKYSSGHYKSISELEEKYTVLQVTDYGSYGCQQKARDKVTGEMFLIKVIEKIK